MRNAARRFTSEMESPTGARIHGSFAPLRMTRFKMHFRNCHPERSEGPSVSAPSLERDWTEVRPDLAATRNFHPTFRTPLSALRIP
jgi:hypothetical protein